MHIRLNIPSWGATEFAYGTTALLGGGRGSRFREELCSAIAGAAPDWHVTLCSSGRHAIATALADLDLKNRGVAVPGYVCPTVLTAIEHAEANAVAIDCKPQSIQFDEGVLRKAIEDGLVHGVLAANTYGLNQDFAVLQSLGVPVIDDAAYQSGMLGDRGRFPGARGDAGVWSLNFKAMNGIGGGVLFRRVSSAGVGSAVPPSSSTFTRDAIRFVNYGLRALAKHRIPRAFPGARAPRVEPMNFVRPCFRTMGPPEMSELQAAVGLAQLKNRHRRNERQRSNAKMLEECVRSVRGLQPLERTESGGTLCHLVPILVAAPRSERASTVLKVRKILHRHGVQTETPYPVVLGTMEELPRCYDLASRLILVPCHASLGASQVDRIAEALSAASQSIR
jgi:dTDP-4-amino-4,6-dideoxygalactose transaminase